MQENQQKLSPEFKTSITFFDAYTRTAAADILPSDQYVKTKFMHLYKIKRGRIGCSHECITCNRKITNVNSCETN